METDPSGQAEELRKLPQVDRLSNALAARFPAPLRVEAARRALVDAATGIRSTGAAPTFEQLVASAGNYLEAGRRNRLAQVVNATGVLLHTNLGRAPLAPEALAAMEEMGGAYSNLEYDLQTASRGSRYGHAAALIKAVTGAEAALVVNNNAAAVLVALGALARGKEAIISRGELIEIGGEFRIPEIMAESGAIMREVGTTNRTHLRDYEAAISDATAMIIKVHPSNYRVVGFTSSVPARELSRLSAARGLIFVHDLGSGLLRRKIAGREPAWLAGEPSVVEALEEGADLAAFSGDKLLGGPQAGILAGKQEIVGRLKESPLLRALRVDKTTLAALESTLLIYLEGREAELPLWRMAFASTEDIRARCEAVVTALETQGRLRGKLEVTEGVSTPGGGSAPGSGIPTSLIKVHPDGMSAAEVHRALIDTDPPVIGRIEKDAVLLDLRTVEPRRDDQVKNALAAALAEPI